MQAAAAVEFRGASLTTGGHEILRGVSCTIAPGERVALLGRSGSGKTTLLRTVNAMAMPTSGDVVVSGRSTREWEHVLLRRHCGYVIQEGGLFPHMTVARNIALPLEAQDVTSRERTARAEELLGMVGLDASFAARKPWQLSGGQRQRVGVARALSADAPLLLMDEPFGALDPLTRREMQEMLRRLLDRLGKTLLIVTHDLTEATRIAGRLLLLEKGSVAADLSRDEFLHTDAPHVREYREAFLAVPQ